MSVKSTWLGFVVRAAVVCVFLVSTASAMNIETVTVGNPGNTGELSGDGAGGYGPNRVCGAVDYEYRIGKYEVTAAQYVEFLNAVGGVDSYGLYDTLMWTNDTGCQIERYAGSGTVSDPYEYRVATNYGDRPVNYVSWGSAARFANWLHNGQPTGAQNLGTTEDGAYYLNGTTTSAGLGAVSRETDWKWAITSEDEWYKAAYHKNDGVTGNYWDYPTSSVSIPSNALITPDPGNNANYHPPYPAGYTIGDPYWRTEVGDFENSESPYGTFDQGGNIFEWTETALYASCRGFRGGSFESNQSEMAASGRGSHAYAADAFNYSGFRVSAIPEPATLSLLALGALTLIRRRRTA